MDKTWMLAGPATLIERGNAVLGDTPLELQNAYMLSEAALQMRQAFSTEDYSASGLDGPLEWIARFVTNQGAEEAWAASNNAGTGELGRRSNNVWGPVTFPDTPAAANLRFMHSVGQAGKFFITYDSAVNRLHVWDGTSVRRVGMLPAANVTAATMGGVGLTFTRWYRMRYVVRVGGVTIRRSEPSPVPVMVAIVDDAGVTVTRGALPVPSDGETHWEVEAADNVPVSNIPGQWYRIGTVINATTTFNDTFALLGGFPLSAPLGTYIPPPSAKYIVSDGAVLLMAGAWESAAAAGETVPVQNRVWFTRPLGASDVSDDESIVNTGTQINWIDVGDAGPITGLLGPVYGEIYVFKAASIYKLVPTGDLATPYSRVLMSTANGAVDQRLITEGDYGGIPAVYFADQSALYVLTSGGVQCVSEGIARDLRQTVITASDGLLAYDPFQRILLFQVLSAPGPVTGSYRSFTFDTAKQQWAGFELGGVSAGWIMGVGVLDISTVLGGSGAAIVNGAYIEDPGGGRRLYLCGQTNATTGTLFKWAGQVGLDVAAPYVCGARYRRSFAAISGRKATIGAPTVFYRNPQGDAVGVLSLQVSFIRDSGEIRTQTVVLTPSSNDDGITSLSATLEGLACADVSTLDVRMYLAYTGTPFNSATAPSVDVLSIPYKLQEPLAR